MASPGVFARKEYRAPDLALMWAVPVPVVQGWIRTGVISRAEADGRVTTDQVLLFVNSEAGQSLLREVREG